MSKKAVAGRSQIVQNRSPLMGRLQLRHSFQALLGQALLGGFLLGGCLGAEQSPKVDSARIQSQTLDDQFVQLRATLDLSELEDKVIAVRSLPDVPDRFAQDPMPVDMRRYWPSDRYRVTVYRRSNSTLYVKRVTKPSDPMAHWRTEPEPGDEHFSREDHFPVEYGSEVTRFDNSWSLVKKANGAVWEIADSFAGREDCGDWCGGYGQVYTSSLYPEDRPGIVHGRPDGHVLDEPAYSSSGVALDWTPDIQRSAPRPFVGWGLFSGVMLLRKYETFTPVYGRKDGRWVEGGGKEYHDVVLVLFAHGVQPPEGTEPCPTTPAGYHYFPGSTTFWQATWLAPDVGPVQSVTLWDERTCTGYEAPKEGVPPVAYAHFIDS